MAPKGVICMLGASTLVLQDPGAILGGSWDIGEPKEEHCDFLFENVRLCVERSRHSWSCPVKRLRSSGAERARAAISGAPAEPSGLERQCRAPQRSRAGSTSETSAGAVFSSSQVEQFRAPWRSRASSSEFERPFRAPQRSRAGSSGHFERPSGAERARCRKRRQVRCFREPGRAISSALAEPSEFERPFRAPQRSRAGSSGHFERPSGAERARAAISSAPAEPSGLERPFRAPQRSRAGSKSQTSAGAVFSSQAEPAEPS